MKPKLLPVIALTASLLLAMPELAYGVIYNNDTDFEEHNGEAYRRAAPPPDADLNDKRPSDEQLGKYYKGCYRHKYPFGSSGSRIVRPGEDSLWSGWYCPEAKTTPTPKPTPDTPKGCGSMVNGKWVEIPCDFGKKTNPPSPTPTPVPTPTPTEPTVPTVPKVPDLPDTEELKDLKQALQELSKSYQDKFNKLRTEGVYIKRNLANKLKHCLTFYSGDERTRCSEGSIKAAQEEMEELQKKIDEVQQRMQEDFAALAKQIASVPNMSSISINIPGKSSAGNVDVNGGGNSDGSNGDAGGNGSGNNITNNITNNNTTIIHNNHNNGGSGGGSGGGTGIGGNGSQQNVKDYSNALRDINNSLNSIDKKLGNGGKSGNDADEGSGKKGNPDGKENGEDKGETLSEYCKNNPNALACTKLGDQEEIDKALQEGKGKDKGHPFGMGEHEIGIPQINRSHDFVESGVCPAPKQVMVLGAMQEFSYQPMCDTASKIRPVVIVSAILLAFFIVQASISKA